MNWFRRPLRPTQLPVTGVQDLVDDVLYPGSPRTTTANAEQDDRHWVFRRILPSRPTSAHSCVSRNYLIRHGQRIDKGSRPTRDQSYNSFGWDGNSTNPNTTKSFVLRLDDVLGVTTRRDNRHVAASKPGSGRSGIPSTGNPAEPELECEPDTSRSLSSEIPPSTFPTSFTSLPRSRKDEPSPRPSTLPHPPRPAGEIERRALFDEHAFDADLDEITALYDREVEEEIVDFGNVVASPDRGTFTERRAGDEVIVTGNDRRQPSTGNTRTPASRLPLWSGTFFQPE